ncbi:MAG: hypothetical protein JW786_06185 [Desulfobacterales bacterium]|nr:hypothetical protein [Desulfobacterales bacterium]
MKLKTSHLEFADQIVKILDSGLHLSKEVVHYIDSTFSNPSIKELEKIIKDESNCERDPLIELIFFPDESFQVQLEELLEKGAFQTADEEKIINIISSKKPQTILKFPDQRGSLKLELPESATTQFIGRFHISKQFNKNLIEIIDHFVVEQHRNIVKVKLRNSGFKQTENKIDFLCSFFKKVNSKNILYFEMLNLLLSFLNELQDDTDIFKALMNKKIFYFKGVQRAKKIEEQMGKGNFEIWMSQGLRMPYVDKNDLLNKMGLIDRISLAVFGRTDYFDQLLTSVDLGEYKEEKSIDKVIDILS